MEARFWIESWDLGGRKTSFHRPDIHPFLTRHLPPTALAGRRVFVPLCGKSVDLIYFAEHADSVVGVELCPRAIEQFQTENRLAMHRDGACWRAGNLSILCMDMFDVTDAVLGGFDILYDRASLVALPLDMRARYAALVRRLMRPGRMQLLNTLEYASTKEEPPFSVSAKEVAAFYGDMHRITHLEDGLVPDHGLIRAWGLSWVREHLFRLDAMGAH